MHEVCVRIYVCATTTIDYEIVPEATNNQCGGAVHL